MSSYLDAKLNLAAASLSQHSAEVFANRANSSKETRSRMPEDFIRAELYQLVRIAGRVAVLAERTIMSLAYTVGFLMRMDGCTLEKTARSWALALSSTVRKTLCWVPVVMNIVAALAQLAKPKWGLYLYQKAHQFDHLWDRLDCDLNDQSSGQDSTSIDPTMALAADTMFGTEKAKEMKRRQAELTSHARIDQAYAQAQAEQPALSRGEFNRRYAKGEFSLKSDEKKPQSLFIPIRDALSGAWKSGKASNEDDKVQQKDGGEPSAPPASPVPSAPPAYDDVEGALAPSAPPMKLEGTSAEKEKTTTEETLYIVEDEFGELKATTERPADYVEKSHVSHEDEFMPMAPSAPKKPSKPTKQTYGGNSDLQALMAHLKGTLVPGF